MPTRRTTAFSRTKRGRKRKERTPHKPGRRGIPDREVREICSRLSSFIKREYGSIYEFVQAHGMAASTVHGWTRKVPDTAMLLALSRETRLSLDWLLFGIGGELQGATTPSDLLTDELRKSVCAELMARDGASDTELKISVPEGRQLYNAVLRNCADALQVIRGLVAVSVKRQLIGRGSVKHLIGAPRLRPRYGALIPSPGSE
jgi:hypothetical protein